MWNPFSKGSGDRRNDKDLARKEAREFGGKVGDCMDMVKTINELLASPNRPIFDPSWHTRATFPADLTPEMGTLSVVFCNATQKPLYASWLGGPKPGTIVPVANEEDLKLPPPRYQHDCKECTYLGQWCDFDLYFCDNGDKTVLARYGDEGAQYMSGMESHEVPLARAKDRAAERGLI